MHASEAKCEHKKIVPYLRYAWIEMPCSRIVDLKNKAMHPDNVIL